MHTKSLLWAAWDACTLRKSHSCVGRLLSAVMPLLLEGTACPACPRRTVNLQVTCCDMRRGAEPRIQSPTFRLNVAFDGRFARPPRAGVGAAASGQQRWMCSAVFGRGALLQYPHTTYEDAVAGRGMLSAADQPALIRLTKLGEGKVPMQFRVVD